LNFLSLDDPVLDRAACGLGTPTRVGISAMLCSAISPAKDKADRA